MVLDPHRMNPYLRPSTAFEYDLFLRDENYLARLGAAVQVPGKLPGTGEDKTGARGLVVFSLNHTLGDPRRLSIGLSISQVAEILDWASVVPIPTRSQHVEGLIFWRDIAVPLVDLAARIGLPSAGIAPDPTEARRYLILRHPLQVNGNHTAQSRPDKHLIFAAVGIDSDVRILRFPIASQPSSRILPVNPAMVRGQVELDTETLLIPDLQTLLTPQAV